MGYSPEHCLITRFREHAGARQAGMAVCTEHGGSFSKIQIAKYLPVLFIQADQDPTLSPGLSFYPLRSPHPLQLPSPSCPRTPR